jgi:hypothetical protein
VPFVVVTSGRENFVIVSQDNDVLVIGYQQPVRKLISPTAYVQVTSEQGTAIELHPSASPSVIEQKDKLTVTPELPQWLTKDVLKSRTDVVRKETVYAPNQRHAYPRGGTLEISGVAYEKYILQIPN